MGMWRAAVFATVLLGLLFQGSLGSDCAVTINIGAEGHCFFFPRIVIADFADAEQTYADLVEKRCKEGVDFNGEHKVGRPGVIVSQDVLDAIVPKVPECKEEAVCLPGIFLSIGKTGWPTGESAEFVHGQLAKQSEPIKPDQLDGNCVFYNYGESSEFTLENCTEIASHWHFLWITKDRNMADQKVQIEFGRELAMMGMDHVRTRAAFGVIGQIFGKGIHQYVFCEAIGAPVKTPSAAVVVMGGWVIAVVSGITALWLAGFCSSTH